MDNKELIARRVAKEFKDGDLVNLGIGIPTMVPNYLPKNIDVVLQSENGFVGLGPAPDSGEEDSYISDAGGQPATILPGGAFFDSATSFMMIRGGHIDVTVLGALEVDQEGNLSNWIIPGKMVPGMGGAMDLVVGARKVIVAMEHTYNGKFKILEKCRLPLTAVGKVDIIITEMGLMEITKNGIVLKEINERYSIEEVQNLTEARLIIPEDLKFMEV